MTDEIGDDVKRAAATIWMNRALAAEAQLASLKARIEELEKALRGMANSAEGFSFREYEIKEVVGITNWNVLRYWIEIARTALQSGDAK